MDSVYAAPHCQPVMDGAAYARVCKRACEPAELTRSMLSVCMMSARQPQQKSVMPSSCHADIQVSDKQSVILVCCRILTGPNASVMTNWLWNLLNVGVSLFGYHFAALSIDWKWWGRKRMQV